MTRKTEIVTECRKCKFFERQESGLIRCRWYERTEELLAERFGFCKVERIIVEEKE